MSVDCFLKIDGIQGESTDPKHKDEIMVLSWSWSETQAMAAAPAGGTGKVSMQDFHFSKAVDTASPKLMLACASGQHIKDAVLSCRNAGGSQDFLIITLTQVAISSYQISDGRLSVQRTSLRYTLRRSNSTMYNRNQTERWVRVQKRDGIFRTTRRRNSQK